MLNGKCRRYGVFSEFFFLLGYYWLPRWLENFRVLVNDH